MVKLVLAVDCDDVLLPSTELIVSLYNEKYGTNVQLTGAHTSKDSEWQASRGEIAERLYDIQLTEEFAAIKPFADAIEVCRRLSLTHELHMVTARPGRIMHMTLAMLNKHFPDIFTEIEHIGLDGNKGEVCRRLQADVLIDDNFSHLETARECGVGGLLWFGEYPWQNGNSADDVVRCLNWYEVEARIERIANH